MTPCENYDCGYNTSMLYMIPELGREVCWDCFKKYEESKQEQLITRHSKPIHLRRKTP
jgi:hypothetical protein